MKRNWWEDRDVILFRPSAFYPRRFTGFNCRIPPPWLHKWRGLRRRGRGYQQAERARRARLTPAEIDALAKAAVPRVLVNRPGLVIERKAMRDGNMFKGIPIYTEEML